MHDPEHGNEDESLAPELLGQKSWSQKTQTIASILWSSFLAAILGSVVFFMFIDPELLGIALTPEREISSLTGYAMCFFFFWFVSLISSATTMFLCHSQKPEHK
jgi:Na+-driven multidrug efflux pump